MNRHLFTLAMAAAMLGWSIPNLVVAARHDRAAQHNREDEARRFVLRYFPPPKPPADLRHPKLDAPFSCCGSDICIKQRHHA